MAAAVLRALGLVERISSAEQNWVDLSCPGGGLVGVHQHDLPSVDLSFEYTGDLDALQQRIAAIDPAASIIDENYARVLRISDPDGGPELWINERQHDLCGFRQHSG